MVVTNDEVAAIDHGRRERLDAEIASCLAGTADDDVALLDEFAGVAADSP